MIELILGIVISVPLTLILDKTARAYLRHRDKRLISRVFPFTNSDTQLEVKCSLKRIQDGKNPPSLRAYVHSSETLALQKIAKHLHGHDVTLNVVSFYSIPQENKNLLLIGAASYNELSKHILECMDEFSIYHYDLILLTIMVWTGNAAAFEVKYNEETGKVEITIVNTLTGNERTIELPGNLETGGEAFIEDFRAIAEQVTVTFDEAFATVSGCIKTPEDVPIVGALVLLVKVDSPQPLSWALTAGSAGIGIFGAPIVHMPVPVPVEKGAGCYSMPIPPGLVESLFTLSLAIGTGLGTGSGPESATSTYRIFSVTAIIPGYRTTPPIRAVFVNPSGTFVMDDERQQAE